MKILVGGFIAESNAYVPHIAKVEDFTITRDESMFDLLHINKLAKEKEVELIPSFFASALATGVLANDIFEYLCKQYIDCVKEHYQEVDGMFFFLHGASYVQDLVGGSGDHEIVRRIREIVGPYMPLAVVNDPHGNLSKAQVDACTILRTFRESPHSDRHIAHQYVFQKLVEVIQKRSKPKSAYVKVPILLGGERCVSSDEPLKSINQLLDKVESDSRILSASYHIGYLRHDGEHCGAGVIVISQNESDSLYAKQKATEIADFVFKKRKEFHFTGNADSLEVCIEEAFAHSKGQVFLSDSGDNVTAGATGYNTEFLKYILQQIDSTKKNILFAGICDEVACAYLRTQTIGSQITCSLGRAIDSFSQPVKIIGKLVNQGTLRRHYFEDYVVGDSFVVKLDNYPITIIVGDKAVSFAELSQYRHAGVQIEDYDIVVVKQGYLYPQLKEIASLYRMALTNGATMQRTELLTYKKVKRPIFPLDDI